MQKNKLAIDFDHFLNRYPRELLRALKQVGDAQGRMYVSGGTVRDLLLGCEPADLDITVERDSIGCCTKLLALLGGGALVKLGTDREEAARIVWRGWTIDFSSFRGGAESIEEELGLRDYTINAMAIPLFDREGRGEGQQLIDPLNGRVDLKAKVLRNCPKSFISDPLRMLRGYRFMAVLAFHFDDETLAEVEEHVSMIHAVAAERIQYEMDRIMASSRAAKTVAAMAKTGLLWQLYPELEPGVGMEQSHHHHKDVFGHSLLALESIDDIFAHPSVYFKKQSRLIADYLQQEQRRTLLRWAALFHDLGKPYTFALKGPGGAENDEKRITFYRHDTTGREVFLEIAGRYRWSNVNRDLVALFVEMHMYPFHLANSRRKAELKQRVFLKLYKRSKEHLPGLFVLAMADSLAGQGELKSDMLEEELALLFDRVVEVVENAIKPVVTGDRLITGNDLKQRWNLEPSPLFRKILDGIETARVEGVIVDWNGAAAWVDRYLAGKMQGE